MIFFSRDAAIVMSRGTNVFVNDAANIRPFVGTNKFFDVKLGLFFKTCGVFHFDLSVCLSFSQKEKDRLLIRNNPFT